jgi:hypothetical protein
MCLIEAIERAERGLIDADLGGGLIRQRVARPGKGRSGGYRTIIAFRTNNRAMFLFGFAKSELDNIGPKELLSLRSDGLHWLNANITSIRCAIEDQSLEEIDNGQEEQSLSGSDS